ncbi:MAG: isochorismatase family protein [Microbacterium sp.]|nr:isochorismatase family protein [Microbacterium sp.]MCV0376539.1 isochorismatase family protein [Microbacterium sp.]MCV0390968.1 isochorismatase family protein [Microbacterium sp.]MCV0419805.1 isochorismatase family protein [Microbacterium sp.]MCV0422808.1 isochorismatase family protein [Microbacterium sp.]
MSGIVDAPAALAASTVILVDFQNTYTRGEMELDGWDAALDAAADLLMRARSAGATVIHVQHDGGVGSAYDIREDIGAIHERVAPTDGEAVVVKTAPNSFVGTELGDLIDAAGHDDVVIAGFMTHMCVTYTTEGAFLRGNRPTVVAAATATRSLPSVVGDVSAAQLHRAALAGIADLYAAVVATAADLS